MSRRAEKAGAERPMAGVKARLDRALEAMESRAGDSNSPPVGVLRGALSLFSVPPENRPDPIPNTNVFLGALYVLGALAALIFAIVDPSCEEVTAYHTDAPIEQCTQMLASFSCRTADYNRTTGAGYSKVFDASSCLRGKNETVERFDAHPAATCGTMKEAIFPCHTADYDRDNSVGLQSSMARNACPATAPHFLNTEVTGAHAPSVCASLKEAKFSCATRDFDADAGAGHEWADFTPTYCPSEEDTAYIDVCDVYPLSAYPCDGFIGESFECQTADYDDAAGAGVKQTFNVSAPCPSDDVALGAGAFADVEVPGVHSPGRYLFKETSFSCQTADYDEAAGTGYRRTCDKTASPNEGNCPGQEPIYHSNGTLSGYSASAYISVEDDWPAEECIYFDEYNGGGGITCKTADYDESTGTGGIKTFSANTCAYQVGVDPISLTTVYTSNGTAPVYDWYDVSLCSDLNEDSVTCRTSSCGTNVDGSVAEGGGIDQAYALSNGGAFSLFSSPYATCRECFEDEDADTTSFPCSTACTFNAGTPEICREAFGLCCGPEPSWYADRTHNRLYDWLGNRVRQDNTAASFEVQEGGNCPNGSMTDPLQTWQCAATGETACACPSDDYATGRTVDRASCATTMALNSYTACGTACGKTYDPSTSTWDSGGDAFDFFGGGVAAPAFDASNNVEFTYRECHGTHPEANVTFATCRGTKTVQVEWASSNATALVPTAFDTCNGTRSVPIEFETCYGTRDMSVQFATCEGTRDLPVSYEFCDGFVVVCPQTPTSVRFSQAMAYASTWMGALAGAYAFLSNRAMQKAAAAKEEEEEARRGGGDGDDDSGTTKATVASRV